MTEVDRKRQSPHNRKTHGKGMQPPPPMRTNKSHNNEAHNKEQGWKGYTRRRADNALLGAEESRRGLKDGGVV